MFGLGMSEILVIAIIVLLLFGGKKIPELMNGLGKGVKSFKDGMKDISRRSLCRHRFRDERGVVWHYSGSTVE